MSTSKSCNKSYNILVLFFAIQRLIFGVPLIDCYHVSNRLLATVDHGISNINGQLYEGEDIERLVERTARNMISLEKEINSQTKIENHVPDFVDNLSMIVASATDESDRLKDELAELLKIEDIVARKKLPELIAKLGAKCELKMGIDSAGKPDSGNCDEDAPKSEETPTKFESRGMADLLLGGNNDQVVHAPRRLSREALIDLIRTTNRENIQADSRAKIIAQGLSLAKTSPRLAQSAILSIRAPEDIGEIYKPVRPMRLASSEKVGSPQELESAASSALDSITDLGGRGLDLKSFGKLNDLTTGSPDLQSTNLSDELTNPGVDSNLASPVLDSVDISSEIVGEDDGGSGESEQPSMSIKLTSVNNADTPNRRIIARTRPQPAASKPSGSWSQLYSKLSSLSRPDESSPDFPLEEPTKISGKVGSGLELAHDIIENLTFLGETLISLKGGGTSLYGVVQTIRSVNRLVQQMYSSNRHAEPLESNPSRIGDENLVKLASAKISDIWAGVGTGSQKNSGTKSQGQAAAALLGFSGGKSDLLENGNGKGFSKSLVSQLGVEALTRLAHTLVKKYSNVEFGENDMKEIVNRCAYFLFTKFLSSFVSSGKQR